MARLEPALLTPDEWRRALRALALCCAGSDVLETPERLCEINALLGAATAMHVRGVLRMRADRLWALLDLGAWDTAVTAMLAQGTGYLVSRSGDGASLATITLPGSARESSASGASPALALIGALACAVASTRAEAHTEGLAPRGAAYSPFH